MSVQIDIEGLEAVQTMFKRLPEVLERRIHQKMREIVQEGVVRARDLAPERTGYLRSMIGSTELGNMQFQLVGLAPYTYYQEYGTRFISPRLFMTAAFQWIVYSLGQISDETTKAILEADP